MDVLLELDRFEAYKRLNMLKWIEIGVCYSLDKFCVDSDDSTHRREYVVIVIELHITLLTSMFVSRYCVSASRHPHGSNHRTRGLGAAALSSRASSQL